LLQCLPCHATVVIKLMIKYRLLAVTVTITITQLLPLHLLVQRRQARRFKPGLGERRSVPRSKRLPSRA
jgi:hypothetical protein